MGKGPTKCRYLAPWPTLPGAPWSAVLDDDGPLADAVPTVSMQVRRALLDRFGVFGIRISTMLIGAGTTDSAAALATELVSHSGLHELQDALHNQFTQRREVLKVRSGLLALDRVLRADPRSGSEWLSGEFERIVTGVHEFVELRLLSALWTGAVTLPDPMLREAERLLGGLGAGPAARLGLPTDTDPDELRKAALEILLRWQGQAENPMSAHTTTAACRVVVRTCEGMVASVTTWCSTA